MAAAEATDTAAPADKAFPKDTSVGNKPSAHPNSGDIAITKSDSLHDQAKAPSQNTSRKNLSVSKVITLWLSVGLVAFLVWLDEGIVSNVISTITDDFHALDDVGWYASSYLFALCAFQLPFGKIYADFNVKLTFLACLLVFEVGSIVEAAAPSSIAFIIGRVIAGIGGAGLLTGTLVIFAEAFPKEWIGFTMSSIGFIYGVGIIAGPVIGGAIAKSYLGWRWCFWINPIISVATVIPILLVYKPDRSNRQPRRSVLARLADVDWLGAVLFAAAAVSFLLALQFGSTLYAWSNGRTIATFVVAGICAIAFGLWQWHMPPERAMMPAKLVRMRAIIFGMQYTASFDGCFFILEYFLPLYFQGVQNVDPQTSAVRLLALLASVVGGVFITGIIVGKIHRYYPGMLFSPVLLCIGSGLLSTLTPTSSTGAWAGYQVIAGLGMGFGTQLPLMAAQDALGPADQPHGFAMVLTAGYLGSSTGVSLGQVVFASRFTTLIGSVAPGVDARKLLRDAGATTVAALVPPAVVQQAIVAYSRAITDSFYVAAALAALALIGAFGVPWRRMHGDAGGHGHGSVEGAGRAADEEAVTEEKGNASTALDTAGDASGSGEALHGSAV